jgi:amino acid transporter
MINTFGVHVRKYMNSVSVWWHVLGTTAIVIAILAAAPKHQSGKFVFRTFIDNTGVDGIGWSQRASPAYVAVIGILMAQYTLLGWTHTSLEDIHFLIKFQDSMRARI